MKIHGICDFTLNFLIPYMKFEKIEKGIYYIKKEENWKKVACILRGRLKVKFNDNLININDDYVYDYEYLYDNNVDNLNK
jgi:hypothetical protein